MPYFVRPVTLSADVEARRRRADQAELATLLQRDLRRRVEAGRALHELAIADRSPAGGVVHGALARDKLRARHAPLRCGGFHQHLARGSARGAQAHLPGETHGGGTSRHLHVGEPADLAESERRACPHEAGRLPALEQEALDEVAVGERGIGGRLLGADLAPCGIEFLGRHHGERRVRSLSHVRVRDVHGDDVVRVDADPAREQGRLRQLPRAPRVVAVAPGEAEHADAERAADDGPRSDQPRAPLHDGTFSVAAAVPRAASWIACRTRG